MDDDEKRTIKVVVYFNRWEHTRMEKKARKRGLGNSPYMRIRAIEEPQTIVHKVYGSSLGEGSEYRDFDEPEHHYTKRGRQLPLIPGTPAYKKEVKRKLKSDLMDELKISIAGLKKKADEYNGS